VSHTNVGNEMGIALRDVLRNAITNANFEFVCDFQGTTGSKFGRGAEIKWLSNEPFFSQERLYIGLVRCQAAVSGNDPEDIHNLVEEVIDVLRDNLANGAVWQGLRIEDVNYDIGGNSSYKFADIPVSVLRVYESQLTVNGVLLRNRFFTRSIDDAGVTLTGINHGSSVLANLQDRDLATDGFDNTSGATMGVEIDLGSANSRVCDYMIVGNVRTNGTSVTVRVYYHDGASWVLNGTITLLTLDGSNLHIPFDSEVTRFRYKVEFDPSFPGSYQLQFSYIFLGEEFELAKTYDLADAGFGLGGQDLNVNVETTVDGVKGYKNKHQDGGIVKQDWDVTWGLRKSDVEALMADLTVGAELNNKNFLFFDAYRGAEFVLVSINEDSLRVNQVAADYQRLNLKMTEV